MIAAGQPGGSDTRGFSLLELLVVMAITGILIGMVVPFADAISLRGTRSTAEDMAKLINQARTEAILSACVWQIQIDPEADTLRFYRQEGDGGFVAVPGKLYDRYLQTADADISRLIVNGTASDETSAIFIYPTGDQDPFEFSLVSPGGTARLVSGATGETGVSFE